MDKIKVRIVPTAWCDGLHAVELAEPIEPKVFCRFGDPEARNVVLNDNEIFIYKRVSEGIYAYALYCKADPSHRNRPYHWSSNHEFFAMVTGIPVANVGAYAVELDRLESLPEGWEWDEYYGSVRQKKGETMPR